jgi:methyltransferase-like protein/cyclopropane fatty-acyl-phospholipid synthase-like methyltransferase
MEPRPVSQCRILELGCASGGNLIPLALAYRDSHFVGIDLSPRQIASGQQLVAALGLTNIELLPLSIMDIDGRFGTFDYLICHGVYSWVPAAVQDKILSVCKEHLAPQGVAYVSYNTYPGWHIRGMIREMMGYHVGQFSQPGERVQQARAFLDFLIESVSDAKSPYGDLLQQEARHIESASDTYVYHEHLEAENHPLYFHEFAQRSAAKGLQYVAEARPQLLPANLSPQVVASLKRLSGDLVQGEQYLDFVRNRTFRRTLLCHAQVALQRPPALERMMTMQVTTQVRPMSEQPDIHSPAAEQFRTADGSTLSTNNPAMKAALVTLFEAWPQSVPFASLWQQVMQRLGRTSDPCGERGDREDLARSLLQCHLSNMVELHIQAFRFIRSVTERPIACQLARLQAETSSRVTNRRHRTVELADLDRVMLRLLDGSRCRTDLRNALTEMVDQGEFTIEREGQALSNGANVQAILEEVLSFSLRRLQEHALLVGGSEQ